MIKGRPTDPIKVIKEKMISDMLPIRPISPARSLVIFTSSPASYLKYISPTQVEL